MKCANSQMLVARSTPCNGWIRTKTHICEGTKITFLFLQSTRVDWVPDSVYASQRGIKTSQKSRCHELCVATIPGGKEFQQDEDFGIRVTAKDNTERVQPIIYDAKHGLT